MRFTSLFGCAAGGVFSEKIGVVDPVFENAREPFEKDMAEDPGREVGVLLVSPDREADMLLDSRRSHERGPEIGVLACEWDPSSPAVCASTPTPKLLFCRVVLLEDALPCSPNRAKRVDGAEKECCEVWSKYVGRVLAKGSVLGVATAVMSACSSVADSRARVRPTTEVGIPAPIAHRLGTVRISLRQERAEGSEEDGRHTDWRAHRGAPTPANSM